MKTYVSEYNNVVTAAKRSTLASKTAYIANIMQSTSANADKLAEMGVTINANGTLQLNEGKLKTADLSQVQDLFSNNDIMSYGSKVTSASSSQALPRLHQQDRFYRFYGFCGYRQDNQLWRVLPQDRQRDTRIG